MKIGILGTGQVGATLGTKLLQLGHEVKMGSRSAHNEKALAWVNSNGAHASNGTFSDAASFGEILLNCTSGQGSLEALSLADAANMEGKILIDVSNPLDFSKGMPPTMSICNTDSLGEQIQRTYPNVKVVKTLNTLNCILMTKPESLGAGDHDLFMSGNDAGAKAVVRELLSSFGWKNIHDLGDISTSRGTEQWLPLWIRLMGSLGTVHFNLKIVK